MGPPRVEAKLILAEGRFRAAQGVLRQELALEGVVLDVFKYLAVIELCPTLVTISTSPPERRPYSAETPFVTTFISATSSRLGVTLDTPWLRPLLAGIPSMKYSMLLVRPPLMRVVAAVGRAAAITLQHCRRCGGAGAGRD